MSAFVRPWEMYAIRRPSGDHAGPPSKRVPAVSRRFAVPSMRAVQMSPPNEYTSSGAAAWSERAAARGRQDG